MKMIPIVNTKRILKFNYFVTDEGQIYSEYTKRFLTKHLDKDGYEKVRLVSLEDNKRHAYSVHRLVLENFNPVDDMCFLQVNHKDGNKLNNNLFNLEWCTCQENIVHAHKNGLCCQKGERNNASKTTDQEVIDMINTYFSSNLTGVEISKLYGKYDDFFGEIKRKEKWAHLTEGIDFNKRFNDQSKDVGGKRR